jgi:uncharacterized integral membrane protein (TIGR00697 family)
MRRVRTLEPRCSPAILPRMLPHQDEPPRAAPVPRSYRYYDLVMVGFVTVLLCSNLIGPAKVSHVALGTWWGAPRGITFSAADLFFPISYIFGDILTEVYGYARARRVIWAGFVAQLFAAIMGLVIVGMPVYGGEPFNEVLQPALSVVFGNTWRIVLGSVLAFWAGDFSNSYVLAKMKIVTRGRFLWVRTIGSTIVGEGVDCAIFYPVALAGTLSSNALGKVAVFSFVFKVLVEAVFTPLTYLVVGWLKRAENEDYYDRGTNFTPFSLEA